MSEGLPWSGSNFSNYTTPNDYCHVKVDHFWLISRHANLFTCHATTKPDMDALEERAKAL
jgi:hypothetical protein